MPIGRTEQRPIALENRRAPVAPGPDPAHLSRWLERLDAELSIAAEHARYARRHVDDIAWVHRHLHHVRHAMDSNAEVDGPGLGTGAHLAARTLAAVATPDANPFAKRLALTGANAGTRIDEIMSLIDKVLAETAPSSRVAHLCERIERTIALTRKGHDANRNGEVEWLTGEAGTAQALALAVPSFGPPSKR